MPTKIFVGNLSGNTRSEEIRILFEKYGKVTECDVLKNFGFVHMQDESEADTAITELDGYSVKGNRMRVEKSTGKSTRRGGGGGGDRRGGGRGGRGGGRGGGGRGDRYSSSRYDPYSRPPSYDYYERRYPPPPRDDRRLPPQEDDRYARDRYSYDRRPPPPSDYDRYDRRPPPPDPYYRDRSGLSRPPPDYYARSDPHFPEYPDFPDDRGDYGPMKPNFERPSYSNGYGGDAPPPQQSSLSSEGQNYYDRFYKTPPAKPIPGSANNQELMTPGQGFLQSRPIYF